MSIRKKDAGSKYPQGKTGLQRVEAGRCTRALLPGLFQTECGAVPQLVSLLETVAP